MKNKLNFYLTSLSKFRSKVGDLNSFALQRIYVLLKKILRLDPPYEFEKMLTYDLDTELTIKKINAILSKSHRRLNLLSRAKAYLTPEWEDNLEREKLANEVVKVVNSVLPFKREEKFSTFVEEIKCRGNVALPEKNFSKVAVDDVLKYLETKKVFPSHAVTRALKKSCSKNETNNGVNPFGSYDTQTILGSSHLAKLVGDEEIITCIGNYFGCIPTLANINLFWSFVRPDSQLMGPQNYHRDVDDHKIVSVFINLTDTAENDGAYCYIEKTHNLEQASKIFDPEKGDTVPDELNPFGRPLKAEDVFVLPFNGFGWGELFEHLFKGHARQLFGPAGTVICADGYGLHRGIPPKSRDRLLFWLAFTLTRVSSEAAGTMHLKRSAYSDVEKNIENTSLNRYVLRNIIDFSK
jgi:hypothetical protein